MTTLYLGEFEQVVLLAVLRLGDGAYAIPIREEIEARTGRSVARGALYTALERLESKGCLRSTMKHADAPRAGRPRRYFALTPGGVAALRATHVALRRMTSGLEAILEH
jgi:PadR family transcriptional regulator, regulatory protein PadR